MTPYTYAYKAYLDVVLGFAKDARKSYLTASGFFDDANSKEAFTENQSLLIRPKTITTDGKGVTIELQGKLHLDLFFQPKSILGGVQVKLFFIPNDPKFYLNLIDETITPSVQFEDISLFMNRAKIAYPVVSAHTQALSKGSAKYPIVRGLVKSFNINSGVVDSTIDNAIFGTLPRRIFIVLVKNKAFAGNYLANPYNFEKFNVNYLAVHIDGQQYPMKAYTPDFEKNFYSREYLALFESLNQLTTDSTISLNKEEWVKGNVIYGFNFAPDLGDDCCKMGFANLIKSGALKIEIKFKQALVETITLLMYCEYDSLVEIDLNREVHTDYM